VTVAATDLRAYFAAPPAVDRLQAGALAAAAAGLLVCAFGLFVDPEQLLRSWLLGVVFWVGISIGCLALLMIHHLTSGRWGVVVRRVFEAAAAVLPLLFLLTLPILFGLDELYVWTEDAVVAASATLRKKAPYLDETFFVGRVVLYFAVWIGLTSWLRALSDRQDRAADPKLSKRMQAISAPGIVVWAFVTTFFYFDLLMSLEPLWFSTIYGVYFFGGSGLSSMAFLILVAAFLARSRPMDAVIAPRHFHDWGKLTLAFVLLWAYFAFSQFLIIWSGNLPEEIEWYLHRMSHGWQYVGLSLALLHFALPFALLLSRDLKKQPRRLAALAVFILAMRWVDHLWQIEPVFHPHGLYVHWLDVAAPVAVGGLWLAAFAWLLKRRPIVPIHDPWLAESVGEEAHA